MKLEELSVKMLESLLMSTIRIITHYLDELKIFIYSKNPTEMYVISLKIETEILNLKDIVKEMDKRGV